MSKNAHSRIVALGPNRKEKIDTMLSTGKSASHVARVIQDEWGFYVDDSFETLKKAVVRYRRDTVDVPLAARQRSVEQSKSPETQRKIVKAAEKLDLTGEWVKLLKTQMARVDRLRKFEEQSKMPLPSTSQEIKLLNDMFDRFGKFALETGLFKRMPRDVRALIGVGDLSDDGQDYQTRFEAQVQQSNRRRKTIHNVIGILRGEDEQLEHQPSNGIEHEIEDAEYELVEADD